MKLYYINYLFISFLIFKITASEIKYIKTVDEFETEVINASQTNQIIVDFFGPWCTACKKFNPIFEELANKYKDKIKFIKINVDDAEELSDSYDIRTLPTLFFVNQKKIIAKEFNFKTEKQMHEFINKYFGIKITENNNINNKQIGYKFWICKQF